MPRRLHHKRRCLSRDAKCITFEPTISSRWVGLQLSERTMVGCMLRFTSVLGLVFCFVQTAGRAQDKPIATRLPWTTSRVQGSPEPPAPYRLAPAFPRLRFELPTSLEEIPGT